jgi:SAM-dependent methyltransferase
MIQDPQDRYLATILSQCGALEGKELLEIGCGKGRITRDLARHARRVVACDPDGAALETARRSIGSPAVEFLQTPTGVPKLAPASFDLVLYTLSLHHVPQPEMISSLQAAAALLRPGGGIVVIEPGDGGSFTEAKNRFGAGSGDETEAKAAAARAMRALPGWQVGATILFYVGFFFEDLQDFLDCMLPDYREKSPAFLAELTGFLERHRTDSGILLSADRRFNLLRRLTESPT